MGTKEKMALEASQHRDSMMIIVPLIIATVIVIFRLVAPEDLGYFADAYTLALLLPLVIFIGLGVRGGGK